MGTPLQGPCQAMKSLYIVEIIGFLFYIGVWMLNRNIGIIDISVDVNRNIGGAHMAGQERILDLTKELGQLGDLIGKAPNLDDFLSSGLAWLGDMAPYDLATVWQIDGDQLRVRTAVGRLTTRKVLEHVVDLSKQKDLLRVLAGRTQSLTRSTTTLRVTVTCSMASSNCCRVIAVWSFHSMRVNKPLDCYRWTAICASPIAATCCSWSNCTAASWPLGC